MIIELPKVSHQGKEYFVDNRLREYRTVDPPLEFVPFDSELGREIHLAADAAAINKHGGATMAQEEQQPANAGTDSASSAQSTTPKWDSFDGEMYPFLTVKEEQKRAGFRIQFLIDKPRKETVNNFDSNQTDFWFDVVHEGTTFTWTVSQKSLIMELRKHTPLKNKVFDIKLVPVTDEFKKQFPKYKGKDRYEIKYVETREAETVSAGSEKGDSPHEKPIPVEDL